MSKKNPKKKQIFLKFVNDGQEIQQIYQNVVQKNWENRRNLANDRRNLLQKCLIGVTGQDRSRGFTELPL